MAARANVGSWLSWRLLIVWRAGDFLSLAFEPDRSLDEWLFPTGQVTKKTLTIYFLSEETAECLIKCVLGAPSETGHSAEGNPLLLCKRTASGNMPTHRYRNASGESHCGPRARRTAEAHLQSFESEENVYGLHPCLV